MIMRIFLANRSQKFGAIFIPALLFISLNTVAGESVGIREKNLQQESESLSQMATGSVATQCKLDAMVTLLDLVEVVHRALCRHPQTRQAWANVKIQTAQLGISKAAYFPTISATISASKERNNIQGSDTHVLYSNDETRDRSNAINLSWTLFDFGFRNANLDNAKELLNAANAAQDAALQSVFLSATQAYYDVLTSQGAHDASIEAEKFSKENFMAAGAKYKAGAGTLADKLQAQTNLGQATLNRVRAEGNLKNAQGTLAIAIGLEANTPIPLVSVEEGVFPDTKFVQSVDVLIEEAKRQHPTLIAAQAQWRAAVANVNSAQAEGLPTISMNVGINRNRQPASSGQLASDTATRSSSIVFQLNFPIFEGSSRTHKVRLAQAQAESKKADVHSTEQQVSLDVWKSYQSLNTETENLQATNDFLQSAGQSFDVAKGRYKAGVGNMLELLNAQSALASAQQQRVQAMSNWRVARLKLAASLGRLGQWAIR